MTSAPVTSVITRIDFDHQSSSGGDSRIAGEGGIIRGVAVSAARRGGV
jgi:hypothetical protein